MSLVSGDSDEFQSTHPRGVRLLADHPDVKRELFQSTHPRGVRHLREAFALQRFEVSIHAPAWGATGHRLYQYRRLACFNPRTRVGCDRHGLEPFRGAHTVSIHAPAWGATSALYAGYHLGRCFNPRTRVGCDFKLPFNVGIISKFQSTHPRGVRRGIVQQSYGDASVSIHAPAWGATCPRRLRQQQW